MKRKSKCKKKVKREKLPSGESMGLVRRDEHGRLMPGSVLNPKGNMHKMHVASLKDAMYSAVSADDMRRIITAMREKAANGDTEAAKLLLDRLLGKPEQKIEIDDGPNRTLHELRASVIARLVESPQSLPSLVDKLSPSMKRQLVKRIACQVNDDDAQQESYASPSHDVDDARDPIDAHAREVEGGTPPTGGVHGVGGSPPPHISPENDITDSGNTPPSAPSPDAPE